LRITIEGCPEVGTAIDHTGIASPDPIEKKSAFVEKETKHKLPNPECKKREKGMECSNA
jgi:hypothetical protein